MSLIEGIGDELTITVSIFVVFLTLVAAWISTRVSDNRLTRSQLSGLHIELNQLTQERQTLEGRRGQRLQENPEHTLPDESAETSTGASPEEMQNEDNSPTHDKKKCEESPDSLTESRQLHFDDTTDNIAMDHGVDNSDEIGTSVESQGIENVSSPGCTVQNRHQERKRGEADSAEGSKVKTEKTCENKSDNRSLPRGDISLKIKFLNETERVVRTSIEETVGNFKRLNFSEESRNGRVVHLIFNGQFLRDDNRQLGSYSIVNNCVLHCHISQHQQSPGSTSQQQEQGEIDLGQFMVPLFACTIGFVWYLRWQYSYMFNTMSTMSLSAVTVLFMLAVLAAWRG